MPHPAGGLRAKFRHNLGHAPLGLWDHKHNGPKGNLLTEGRLRGNKSISSCHQLDGVYQGGKVLTWGKTGLIFMPRALLLIDAPMPIGPEVDGSFASWSPSLVTSAPLGIRTGKKIFDFFGGLAGVKFGSNVKDVRFLSFLSLAGKLLRLLRCQMANVSAFCSGNALVSSTRLRNKEGQSIPSMTAMVRACERIAREIASLRRRMLVIFFKSPISFTTVTGRITSAKLGADNGGG